MCSLLEPLSGGPGGVGTLAARQVHQVNLGQGLVGHPLQVARLHEADGEDGVGAAGGVVHVGGGGGAELIALLHEAEDVAVLHHQVAGQVLHVRALARVLTNLEPEHIVSIFSLI